MNIYFRSIARIFARPVFDRLRARFGTKEELKELHARIDQLGRATEGRLLDAHAIHDLAQEQWKQLHARIDQLGRATEGRLLDTHAIHDLAQEQWKQLHARIDQLGRATEGRLLDAQAIHDLAQATIAPPPPHALTIEDSITVIVPTCDRPGPLERAIRSLDAQTRRPDRIIVVDDGDVDASWVTRRFCELNILYLKTSRPRSGSSAARNLALDAAQTSIIAWLDDDNIMWPNWIERGTFYLDSDSTIDVIYGAQLRDKETSISDKFWFHEEFNFDQLRHGNFIDINQIMHRRPKCRFDENLRRLVDWDFILRLIANNPERTARVPAIASIYSSSDENRITVVGWPPDMNDAVVNEFRIKSRVEFGQNVCACCSYIGIFIPGPDKRPNAGCPMCGSLERHRFLQLMAPSLYHYWIPETRRERAIAVEIGPSAATADFRKMFSTALTIDSDPAADGRNVNVIASLTDLPISDETVDAVLALHVLEHIPDDLQAMREIARVLLPHGLAVLQVPLSGRVKTDEGDVSSVAERIDRFGQADHVRFYGDDFFQRLNEAGLRTVAITPMQSMAEDAIQKYGLLPDQSLVFAVRANSRQASKKLQAFQRAMQKGAMMRARGHT
jgi:hypothetical protein